MKKIMLNESLKNSIGVHTHTHTHTHTQLTKGISLIVLVITIIIVIILAGSIILSLSNSNPIESANKAKFLSDVSTYKSDLALSILNKYSESMGVFDADTLNLDKNNGMKEYIKSMRTADLDKFCVVSRRAKISKRKGNSKRRSLV